MADAELPQRILTALSALDALRGAAAAATEGGASTDVEDTVKSEALTVVSDAAGAMKRALYGSPDAPPDQAVAAQLASAILRSSVLDVLLNRLRDLSFECRRDTTQVFAAIVRKEPAAVDWLLQGSRRRGGAAAGSADGADGASGGDGRPQAAAGEKGGKGDTGDTGEKPTLVRLLEGYDAPETALYCGTMLREAIRHEPLARWLLEEPSTFVILCRCLESAHFDVASDAFATARDLLTRHRTLVAAFLDAKHAAFFSQYCRLICSQSYVTKRQSLKLLGELLLDRANFATMTRFISSADHLKTIMGLLRDASPSIQYEAFHVFKIFVANPRKTGPVLELLQRNRVRLLAFLAPFLATREQQDEHFRDEKAFLIEEIQKLHVQL